MIRLFVLLAIVMLLVGCAHQPVAVSGTPGFWWGLLQGFIAPLSFIGSLFSDCRIYAFPNCGGWYDFGFMLGIGGFGGGVFASSRK